MEQLKDKNYYAKLTQKLGEETVYGQAVEAAQELIRSLSMGKCPLLCAQMQQGKTAVTLYAANLWINNCMARKLIHNEGFEVYYLINISNNDLLIQTYDRIQYSLLDKIITPNNLVHLANLKKVKPNPDSKRLVIIDECHSALSRKDGNFGKIMERFGIDYGKPKSSWSNQNNDVISVSATPFSHKLKNYIEEDKGKPPVFDTVWLPLDDEYYSFEHLINSKRMRQSKPIIDSGTKEVTPFFKDCMNEFSNRVEQEGNKYLIVRTVKEFRYEIIEDWIKKNHPDWDVVDAKTTDKTIKWDVKRLHRKPARATVVVIRGILRAGQTIETDQYIGGWIETHTADADAMAQSLRILGREKSGYGRTRFDSNFPVYCNMKESQVIIDFFKGKKVSPSGVTSTSSESRITSWRQIPLDQRSNLNPDEAIRACEKFGFQFDPEKGTGYHLVSENRKTDIAGALIRNTGYTQAGEGTTVREYFCDGSHPDHQESWNKLMSIHPEWRGKYILCFPLETRTEHSFSPDMFKPRSYFDERITAEPLLSPSAT
jgi:hypothetical protein